MHTRLAHARWLLVLVLVAWNAGGVAGDKAACETALGAYYAALARSDPQAVRMAGSSGRMFGDLGSFAECVRLAGNDAAISAHYCGVGTGTGEYQYWGLCVPRACDDTSLPAALADMAHVVPALKPLVGQPAHCTAGYPPWGHGAVAMAVLSLLLVAAVVGCSYVHWMWSTQNGALADAEMLTPDDDAVRHSAAARGVLAFSAFHNYAKLVAPQPGGGAFAALNGLRVFSICWVILGHTIFLFQLNGSSSTLLYVFTGVLETWRLAFIFSAEYAVDTFFFLSAFLLAHGVHRFYSRKNRMPPYWLTVLHRLLRLWPLYIFLLFVWIYLAPVAITSPRWMEDSRHNCHKYWWANVLFVNNYVPHSMAKGCMGWTWYLAVDMQLFLVSPLFLFLYYTKKRIGVAVTAVGVAACVIANGVVAHWRHFEAGVLVNQSDPEIQALMTNEQYEKPWMRSGPYLWGILTYWAYLHIVENHGGELSVRTRRVLNFLGYGGVATLTFVILDNSLTGADVWTNSQNAAWFALARTSWAVSLSFVMMPMFLGYRGPVQWLLSLRVWEPLGRLTYGVYLIHFIFIELLEGNSAAYLTYTDNTALVYAIATTALSYGTGFLVYLAVEGPFSNLEKMLLGKLRGGSEKRARAVNDTSGETAYLRMGERQGDSRA